MLFFTYFLGLEIGCFLSSFLGTSSPLSSTFYSSFLLALVAFLGIVNDILIIKVHLCKLNKHNRHITSE